MTITATIEILNSRRDTFGNCYWAFRFIDHVTGCEVTATVSGGESNIRGIALGWTKPREWDRSIQFMPRELGIREFNRLVKDWPHAGCTSDELATFVHAAIINELAHRGRE